MGGNRDTREPFHQNAIISMAAGSGSAQHSFQDIPQDKRLVIEFLSFKLEEEDTTNLCDPICLWAYPAQDGPPYTKQAYFPITEGKHKPGLMAGSFAFRMYLEPGEAWGISLFRSNYTHLSKFTIYISGYYLSAESPDLSP